jgi:hypothetical protein
MKSFSKYLSEAYISPNNGAKYGQVIFLVGGAASGKSTAIRKFINSGSYKTLNPDGIKDLMRQASERGMKGYEDLAGVDPNTPKGAATYHKKMRDADLSSRYSKRIMTDPNRSSDAYPNLLFDRTFSYAGEIEKISKSLIRYGYKSENIHVVYVFTDVNIALNRNRERSRTLADDIVVQSTKGAKRNFIDLLFQRMKAAPVNGDFYMIVNERVISIKKSGKRVDRSGEVAKKVARTLGII